MGLCESRFRNGLMSHVNRISQLTHVLPILPKFATDPRFANITQVGLWWWVNLAHHGSLRQMQQGLWCV